MAADAAAVSSKIATEINNLGAKAATSYLNIVDFARVGLIINNNHAVSAWNEHSGYEVDTIVSWDGRYYKCIAAVEAAVEPAENDDPGTDTDSWAMQHPQLTDLPPNTYYAIKSDCTLHNIPGETFLVDTVNGDANGQTGCFINMSPRGVNASAQTYNACLFVTSNNMYFALKGTTGKLTWRTVLDGGGGGGGGGGTTGDATLPVRKPDYNNFRKIVLLGDSIVHGQESSDHNWSGDIIINDEDVVLPFDAAWKNDKAYTKATTDKHDDVVMDSGNLYHCILDVAAGAGAPHVNATNWAKIDEWDSTGGTDYPVGTYIKYGPGAYYRSNSSSGSSLTPPTEDGNWVALAVGHNDNANYIGNHRRSTGAKSWAALFKNYIETSYVQNAGYRIHVPFLTVVNNGLPAWGTKGLVVNLDNLIPDDTTMAIVCIGINDRNFPTSDIRKWYEDLFDALAQKNITTIALSPTEPYADIFTNYYGYSLATINAVLEDVCLQKGVRYVNLYSELNAAIAMSHINDTLTLTGSDIPDMPPGSDWDNTAAYKKDRYVKYNNATYHCISDVSAAAAGSTNTAPDVDAALENPHWERALRDERSYYYGVNTKAPNTLGAIDNVHPSDIGHKTIFGIICKELNF